MIEELRIEHLGVIAAASVRPGPGFTALTGETGAGKTMVLTALEMLLGGRVDSAISEGASIEGLWTVSPDGPAAVKVMEAGGRVDDGELLLGRTAANGRLRAFAGGRMVPASLLSELGEHLVTIHGQTTQQRLRNPAAQRGALDRFGGADHLHLLAEHRSAHHSWHAVAAQLVAARTSQQQNAQRMVFLRSALEEIERVDPQPGETHALHAEQHRLANLADLSAATAAAGAAVLGDDTTEAVGAAHLLHLAARELASVDDPELSALHERLVALAEEASEVGRDVSGFTDALQDEPGRLEWINQRLHDLAVLQSRYGEDEAAVLRWSQEASAELTDLERGSDLDSLADQELRARRALDRATEALSASRSALAQTLGREATAELQQLAMPNAVLQIVVSDADLGPDGADDVAFLLAAHPGAAPAPVAKAASGGELSRIMLALEVVLADTDAVRTFVFDEVDAGVGGAAATAIGRRLAALARSAQVIVVTHMPQVAAFADTHLRVVKQQDADVTVSDVRALDDEERVVEIARMLAGQEDSLHAREHARELLAARL
ncbi:MAG: DNA repair protein RecN [Actinobacteria bacterium]|nr:DNA repair protein RecN [Actinomycetota bacterium]MCB8996284.1 DNA repair protein RecN [Actinomycetota bacterium]MCB9413841.1 DNA repair protein RecN [Actinomycetota bacterium]HRY11066.1 DNA repair protein RecN [Candidatus Nanopelagicales bacterium]